MEYDIYFCKDGILRAKYSDKYPMVPLSSIQQSKNLSDTKFWFRNWEQTSYFEEGLTVASFLICLEPWADFWSDFTLKNIKSYIAEVRKPTPVEIQLKNKDFWINIEYFTEVSHQIEYVHDKDEDSLLERDFNAWFNSPKTSFLNGLWEINSSYKITGYNTSEQERYSIEHSPLNELANVPLFLDYNQYIYFMNYRSEDYITKEQDLFNKNAFGVYSIKYNKNNQFKYIYGKKYHKLKDIIEGFFWWMYHDPISRDDFNDYLKDIVDSIHEPKQEENTLKKEASNESTDTIKKVVVAPGAFDSIISSHERDKNDFEIALDFAKKTNSILKIGKINYGEPPENRIMGYIPSSNDSVSIKKSPKITK